MKKLLIIITVVVGFAFMANVQVYALSSALDIDELKEEIKEELGYVDANHWKFYGFSVVFNFMYCLDAKYGKHILYKS